MAKSKILCLHGTHTSGEIFKSQLGQLVTKLEKEQNLELHFVDGLIETECHKDMTGMFPGPYYTWCSVSLDGTIDYESGIEALEFVQEIISEDGPFDGILAFSQGAALALALLLRHAASHPLDPAYAICKYMVLFSCVESDLRQWNSTIGVPLIHIFDTSDSMLGVDQVESITEPGSMKALCHDRGHSIPRDQKSVNLILEAIRDLQHRAAIV